MKRGLKEQSRLKEPFGKAGLTVAILALVMGLVGGAYAAGGLTKSQEKQVTKIAKKYAGKPGTAGSMGAAGTNGTNGTPGAPGANGASVTLATAGSCPEGGTKLTVGGESKEVCNGLKGTKGANGKSVLATPLSPGATCEKGGTEFEVEGSALPETVCNGKEGAKGDTGEAGACSATTPQCVLPVGATETGVWTAWGKPTAILGGFFVGLADPISFNIPVASSPELNFILSDGTEQFTHKTAAEVGCPGTAESPAAEAGKLCIYVGPFEENVFKNSEGELRYGDVELVPAKYGVTIVVPPLKKATEEEEEEEHVLSGGSWAVGGN